MPCIGWLQKIRQMAYGILRLIFEDEEVKGYDFSHLKVRGRMLYIDEDSPVYKNMLKTRYKEPRINSAGHIVLPKNLRRELKVTDLVECWSESCGVYIIRVSKPSPLSLVDERD